jgi:hypothetical protein
MAGRSSQLPSEAASSSGQNFLRSKWLPHGRPEPVISDLRRVFRIATLDEPTDCLAKEKVIENHEDVGVHTIGLREFPHRKYPRRSLAGNSHPAPHSSSMLSRCVNKYPYLIMRTDTYAGHLTLYTL